MPHDDIEYIKARANLQEVFFSSILSEETCLYNIFIIRGGVMSETTQMIRITALGEERLFPRNTRYEEIAGAFQEKVPYPILLVRRNGNELRELDKEAAEDCSLEFLTLQDKAGRDTYKRSLCLMMLRAFSKVIHKGDTHIWIRFAVSNGLFCTMDGSDIPLTQELLDQVLEEMKILRDRAVPFEKTGMDTGDAISVFRRYHMEDKAKLFRYRMGSRTNVYCLDGYRDYYYGYMVSNTSLLQHFDLKLYEDGFVLLFPTSKDPDHLPPFAPVKKLFEVQNNSRRWGETLEIDTVGDLNDLITQGRTKDLILMQEALQEKKIAEIAQEIADRKTVRVVLIAGPSSSSKTTFSHRLSIQLSCHGLRPHPLAMDNYFVNRVNTPKNPDGSYDYECLGAIDVEQFNKDVTGLLAGEVVNLPTYNFITGEREYKGNTLQLGDKDVLVVEGIHGLNDELSYRIPAENKYKVYISALTQLNIDEHNRIPTTDGRLLRRIVRDERTRGHSARNTINMWWSVRKGEEQYIFPFQESADVMFNSALIYELAVLKTYAQPVLFAVPKDCPEWEEAKRLLKFLDYFLPIPSDEIPKNSLVREFIGGSIFDV